MGVYGVVVHVHVGGKDCLYLAVMLWEMFERGTVGRSFWFVG